MNYMNKLVEEILKFGLVPAILVVFIFLIVQDPDRAEKLKAVITKPFFDLFRWFSKTRISSEVNSSLNTYFKSSVFNQLIHDPDTQFKVKWVKNSKDPYFKENGSLILRLKEDKDQTKNVINAAKIAIPHVVCPLIRSHLDQNIRSAVDLTILQKLSERLGRHGKAVFKRYFLDPEVENDPTLSDVLSKLVELDKHGVYTPIFLNELELVGEELYANSDYNNYSKEVLDFTQYLLNIVKRNTGDEIELNYIRSPFKLGTILLAKTNKAQTQGVRPYLRRLRMKLDKGCDSIYLISFPNSYDFFNKILKIINSHESLEVSKVINTVDFQPSRGSNSQNYKIAILSNNGVSGSYGFKERVNANNLQVGDIYSCEVEDVSEREALVNLLGLRAYVKSSQSSWLPCVTCKNTLVVGDEYNFKILEIDFNTGTISMSRRVDEENPWLTNDSPEVGSKIEFKVIKVHKGNLEGVWNNQFVHIPNEEISWLGYSVSELSQFIGEVLDAQVTALDEAEFKIIGSLKNLYEDPWPKINELFKKGQEFHGKVVRVNDNHVIVEIDYSVVGILPRESLEKAGFEYANFNETMQVGQGVDVYISKVFIAKKKIRFDLTRNKTPN
tara:strand:+ start:38087 stop:39922 length:1836 start_codon:yes stop_codon:yes gene_type:complete